MRVRLAGLVLLSMLAGMGARSVIAQDRPGCDERAHGSICTKADLVKAVAAAPAIETRSDPKDRFSDIALRDLAKALHKPQDTADRAAAVNGTSTGAHALLFVLSPVSGQGVRYGPNGEALAVLNVYTTANSGAQGELLWTETYFDHPDERPWAIIPRETALQFENLLKSK
jgi:hypothetical protein